jgi:hypothetical protein
MFLFNYAFERFQEPKSTVTDFFHDGLKRSTGSGLQMAQHRNHLTMVLEKLLADIRANVVLWE